MFTSTNATCAINKEAKGCKMLFSGSCIVMTFAAILITGTLNANILTTASATHVHVLNQFNPISQVNCGYTFNYEQKMNFGGKAILVPTEAVYPPGQYDLTLSSTCDGYNIYGVGTCQCLTSEFPELAEKTTKVNSKNIPVEITETIKVEFPTISRPTDFIWIREKKKNDF